MIRVDRPTTGPAVLEEAGKLGKRETDEVLRHYAHTTAQYDNFRAYKHPDVKAELNRLFNRKCAYCEALYQAGVSMQVEHYRPKGAVELGGSNQGPGYYWLAAEWTNLLPSCVRCNSEEHLERYDGTRIKMGKGTKFPLKNESKRATSPGQEKHEEPLLLNPCQHDPSQHLAFDGDGMIWGLTPEGKTSVEVYGLWRMDLFLRRAERAKDIQRHVRKIETHLARIQLKLAEGADCQENIEDLKEDVEALKSYLSPEREFIGLARKIARPILERVEPFPNN